MDSYPPSIFISLLNKVPNYLALLALLAGVRGTIMMAINRAISNTVNMTLFFKLFFNCLIAFGETITLLAETLNFGLV